MSHNPSVRSLTTPTGCSALSLLVVGLLFLFAIPVFVGLSLDYTESKGPFKNWTQVVDLDDDGNLDVLVSHTRWEGVALSWAGIGRWYNQGSFGFRLLRAPESDLLSGHAAAAVDIDSDGDLDFLTQDFDVNLIIDQGGSQGQQPGSFVSSGQLASPATDTPGYRDMGGALLLGDLNGDALPDLVVTGCCYGQNARLFSGNENAAPSYSWVWLNTGWDRFTQSGTAHLLEPLVGLPIRQAALGDLDLDGDLDLVIAVDRPTLGTTASIASRYLINDGSGNFALAEQSLGTVPATSVALGDINADGWLDILLGTETGASLWLNQGSVSPSPGQFFALADQSYPAEQSLLARLQAGFSAMANNLFGLYFPYGSIHTQSVFLVDLDGDADLDLLLARLLAAEIWWNDGAGTFTRSALEVPYREDTGLAVADFDRDGDLDIFIGRNENDYEVWWNSGTGVFSSP